MCYKRTTASPLRICSILILASAGCWASDSSRTYFFVRHGEDTVALRENGKSGKAYLPECKPYLNGDGEIDECCLEILSELGEKRAELLASWFVDEQKIPLTHVFSTYKTRTWQTVLPTAVASGLDAGATDVDTRPGDGVQQIPPFVEECDPGFESPSATLGLVVAEILGIEDGSSALVCGHSSTIYPMMELLGVDTSDPDNFPKRADGRVDGFNNLWIITVDENGVGSLYQHVLLDFTLATTLTP